MSYYYDPYPVCECGHKYCWHVDDEPVDGWAGHFCEYEGCDCMDFRPSGEDY